MRRRWLVRGGQVVMGLVAGLLITELAFRIRDKGAFPRLNVYVNDAERGVRLKPGAGQKVSFAGNPVTSVRINRDGYRGADLPPPSPGEVLVVGDSQVFGLGVEEDQTFSARAAPLLGKTVVNAGVPTYGPAEYAAVVDEMLAKRKPATVVFTINMVNDLFEVDRPNVDRHVARDGWAVRKETVPASATWFPGRSWLYNRSHAVLALRRWLKTREHGDDRGFASEGTWTDLTGAGIAAGQRHDEVDAAIARRRAQRDEITAAEQKLEDTEDKIDEAIRKAFPLETNEEGEPGEGRLEFKAARAEPGDAIYDFRDQSSEEGRAIYVTADLVRRGAAYRRKLQAQLLERARARGRAEVLATFQDRDELTAKLKELDGKDVQVPRIESPLAPILRQVKARCDEAGARLVVLILPMDVQVSSDEWKKYGVEARDMAATKVLIDDIVADAAAMGVTALDATAALTRAQPGAFLHADIHMTPKGHQEVAYALAAAVSSEAPAVKPAVAMLQPGRSLVPAPSVWRAAREVRVTGSTKAGCETKMIREWLRIACHGGGYYQTDMPTGVKVTSGGRGEEMILVRPYSVTLLVPVIEGDELAADFTWDGARRTLSVSWPKGQAAPVMAFTEPVKTDPVPGQLSDKLYEFPSATEKSICECWDAWNPGHSCAGAYGAADAACVATYKGSCGRMLECIRRDPASPAE